MSPGDANISRKPVRVLISVVTVLFSVRVSAKEPSVAEVRAAMHKAVRFFRESCSAQGGYVFQISSDLSKWEGEGKVQPNMTAWIQPPATPTVGMAYLSAYQLTRDPVLKQAALETAEALLRGQLVSGGWSEKIEFAPEKRAYYAYRVDGHRAETRKHNVTTFDDDKSQSVLRFLMLLDEETQFRNRRLHEAVLYAIDAFLQAQYAIGAWPQRYSVFPKPEESPILKASFPKEWPRKYPGRNYAGYYTFNDNTISDLIRTMLLAYQIYDDERCFQAAESAGQFCLLAQLPDPQPGWAQQYNRRMQPAWARKFEPPAVTGGEAQGVMRILLTLYRFTGKKQYLEPIPRALDYYRSSLLDDGRLARFYEMGTNRPLYFTKEYRLTYSDSDLPTHYGFQVTSRLDQIEREFQKLIESDWKPPRRETSVQIPRMTSRLRKQAQQAISTLDERGAWVENGRLRYHGSDDSTRRVITTRTFTQHLQTLSQFLAASQE